MRLRTKHNRKRRKLGFINRGDRQKYRLIILTLPEMLSQVREHRKREKAKLESAKTFWNDFWKYAEFEKN